MTKPVARDPSGFDYGFRPDSYFDNLDPGTLIVGSILGEERRKDVQARLASGNFDPLVWGDWLTESKLDDSVRKLIGQADPRFMGGEYLPELAENEIEIARIVCASVMQDVTSVRARRSGKRITYRVMDEHDGKFTVDRSWSRRPLTLGELVRLINCSNQEGDTMATGLVFSILDWNIDATGEPEEMRGFITVSSVFYPDLGRYYDEAIGRHLDGYLDGDEGDEDDDEAEAEAEATAGNGIDRGAEMP